MNELLSISEVASLLNVHPETLRRWDKSNLLKPVRLSDRGHRKYRQSDIEKFHLANDATYESLAADSATVYEVDGFPLQHIPIGATFTFLPSTAAKATEYTHGLHVYPAKFIPQIPRWAIQYAALQPGSLVLDPFCGSGTTQLEALLSGHNALGIDVNPVGQLLSAAKTTRLFTEKVGKLDALVDVVVAAAEQRLKKGIDGKVFEHLHENWEYWFPKGSMEQLFALRLAIEELSSRQELSKESDVQSFQRLLLAVLSSVVKKCSYFDEREIKVRRDVRKTKDSLPSAIDVFQTVAKKRVRALVAVNRATEKVTARLIGSSAQDIQLEDNSVDLIVTSPPYINAIDYAMAHKYSLFILGLVDPPHFKEHCRAYTGVTERAVRVAELVTTTAVGHQKIDELIAELNASKDNVDRIRAYILSQYFRNMRAALHEMYRTLKPGQLCIIVVGDNIIRKRYIPTSEYLQEIAISEQVGFELVTYFFHQLRNVRLKVARNKTGGKIKQERVIVLRKGSNG